MEMLKEMNLFIVDDNKLYSQLLKGALEASLEDLTMHIQCFGTGEECIGGLMEQNPELIILDYNLNSHSGSAADGLVILDRIKKLQPDTPVIMLTSSEDLDVALTSFHRGAADFVVKKNSQFDKIKSAIGGILHKRELGREKSMLERISEDKREQDWGRLTEERNALEKSILITEEKHKNITDSINYARRIQDAKLPAKADVYSLLPHCFILNKPKDIVSGDFYYCSENNDLIFIAVADCTGHGVPGAFLTMIGSEKLQEAAAMHREPSRILNQLNREFKRSLRQTTHADSTRDGMDIAFCSLDKTNGTLCYAGANRPIWIIRAGTNDVVEIKATKKGIGGLTSDEQHFTMHKIQLYEGDTFYLFSDGYADTFGGPSGKKLMRNRFKDLLLHIQDHRMDSQEFDLDHFIERWKSGTEQVDDILVVGVRM
jgi:sigma-B regulation protein RsbU (phosphoserine phosphatase)